MELKKRPCATPHSNHYKVKCPVIDSSPKPIKAVMAFREAALRHALIQALDHEDRSTSFDGSVVRRSERGSEVDTVLIQTGPFWLSSFSICSCACPRRKSPTGKQVATYPSNRRSDQGSGIALATKLFVGRRPDIVESRHLPERWN
ncbi:unnamed protein product [Haemonchus placei]|uniref:Nucleotidyltransferase n=1 Tax=Haemonchus placei TaxID=6290 RepID=A0A0N4X3M0_HAEPC|nr:unnamed protein product [Haemonchus placei]